jgi:putative peptidoglycan lipid II flippase
MIGFLVLGGAIVTLLLEGGRFTREDTVRTWAILGGYALGLVASSLGRLYSSAFYALRDTRTPFRFALARIVISAALGYLLAFPVQRALGLPAWTGAVGLTAASGIGAWIEYALLRRAIGRRIGSVGAVASTTILVWMASLVAATAGWGVTRLPLAAPRAVQGAMAIAAFALVYGAVTLALGVPQARAIAARVRRR